MFRLIDAPQERNLKPREKTAELAVLCGGSEPTVVNAIESVRIDLEPLYEALAANGDRWAAGALHHALFKLERIARIAR